jgi:hypothetical protein
MSECSSLLTPLGQRATALLNIGTEQKTIREVAHECGVAYWRLRLDLKCFMRGGLKQIIEHSPCADILIVKGVQKAFFDWCNSEYELTGHAPSGAAAQEFLESEDCRIRMLRRTVYTHLEKWRKTRRIPPRKHRPKVKYKKSEGLTVKPISQH